jgi:hypothetical protein
MSQPQYEYQPQQPQPGQYPGAHPSGPMPQAGYPQAGFQQPYGYMPMAQPAGNPPPDHLAWAIVAILFFWPLAIAAFIQRNKIQPAWMMGDVATATKASNDTKKYGIIALCIGLVWIALVIILSVTAAATVGRYGY